MIGPKDVCEHPRDDISQCQNKLGRIRVFGFETLHVSHLHTNVSPLPHQVTDLIKAESHALNDRLGRLDSVTDHLKLSISMCLILVLISCGHSLFPFPELHLPGSGSDMRFPSKTAQTGEC